MEQIGHDVGGVGANRFVRFGTVLLDDVPLAIRDAHDGVRPHADALVRERRVGARHVPQGFLDRPQSQREIRRHVRRQAEPRGHLDHVRGPELRERLHRGNVARVFQRPSQGDRPLVLAVVIERFVRRLVRPRLVRDRLVDEDRHRRVAAVDGGRVDERLERRADLPPGLRRAVELAARDQQRALDHRILFEPDRLRHAALDGADVHLDEVADLQEIDRGGLSRPRERRFRQLHFMRSDADARAAVAALGRHRRHERGHDVAGENRPVPAIRREPLERALLRQDVAHLAEAAMPLVEPPQPAIDGAIGRLLQLRIERRLDLQPVLIQRIRAVFLLERLPDLLDEVRRDGGLRTLLPLEDERTLLRLLRFLVRDVAFFRHPLQRVVAPHQRRFRIDERAEAAWRLDDAGNDRGLFDGQVLRGLVEVQVRRRLDAVRAVAKIDLVGVEREDFRLGEALLDLNGDDPFLDLPFR